MNFSFQLLQVEAVDADSGTGGQVEYRLIGGDKLGQFAVSSTNGNIVVVAPLDREKVCLVCTTKIMFRLYMSWSYRVGKNLL